MSAGAGPERPSEQASAGDGSGCYELVDVV
jgi:hypothetical protein